jgi:phospholipase C
VKKRAMIGCLTAALTVVSSGIHAAEISVDGITVTIPPITIPPIKIPPITIPPLPIAFPTKMPIKHLVVIFGENRSFDHYFATYPVAQNNPGELPFKASPLTPLVNNLVTPLDVDNNFVKLKGLNLLAENPNGPNGTGALLNGASASNPFRISPANAWTTGNNHNYMPEQQAYDNGLMDKFPHFVGDTGTIGNNGEKVGAQLTMAYFDGNTVAAMWNLAQHFALNDNMYTTSFGPSTPGALNLISGQTNSLTAEIPTLGASSSTAPDGQGGFTEIGDLDPLGDVCSSKTSASSLAGQNIGDLLNVQNVTWGWFAGGFDLTVVNANGTTGCARSTTLVTNPAITTGDYVQHHEPFQFYAGTRNLTHARPTSVAAIGHTMVPGTTTVDPANHQYDTHDFFDALAAGNFPAVSFLKAPAFQDSHPSNSDPLDEQTFIVNVLNTVQNSPDWSSTAVIITYDDSDGWYDHQMPPIVNPSKVANVDELNLPGVCNSSPNQQGRPVATNSLPGTPSGLPVNGRCGYGTRVPFLVVSPFAKSNFVDHTLLDQSSVTRFIEDNWLAGQRLPGSFDALAGSIDNMFDFNLPIGITPKLFMNPANGQVTKTGASVISPMVP